MTKRLDVFRALGLRRAWQVSLLLPAVAVIALVSAGQQASRAAVSNPLTQTFEGEFSIKLGATTVTRPARITTTSIPASPTGSAFNGYVSRVQVDSVVGEPVQGDIQLDTAATGWKGTISRPSLFRLQVPSLDAAKVYVDHEWRILSSPPGGYAQITAGFVDDGRHLTIKSSGRIAFLANAKISQYTFNLDIAPNTVLDAPPVVVSTFPGDGATNQPATTLPHFQMSEPVTAPADAFTFHCDGDPVAFTTTYSGSLATLVPENSAPLPTGAECEVTVDMTSIEDQDDDDPPSTGVGDASFTFTVTKVVAQPDSTTVERNAPATAIDVLGNDTNPDKLPLSISAVTQPANGQVVLTPAGSGPKTGLTYRPKPGYCNMLTPEIPPDTFAYTVTPGGSTAIVSVTVTCNRPPMLLLGPAPVFEVVEHTTAVTDFSAVDPDGDVEGAGLTYSISGPNAARFSLDPSTGKLDFAGPIPPDFESAETNTFVITVTVTDSGGLSDTRTVTVNVLDVNEPPLANSKYFAVNEGGTLLVNAPGVLFENVDHDAGTTLTAELVDGPSHASFFQLNLDGSFTYVHDGSETTSDSFNYRSRDNGGLPSNPAPVFITIYPLNHAPVAADDHFSVDEGGTLLISGPGVLSNDTDQDGDSLMAVQASGPLHASFFKLNADGSFTYVHDGGQSASDTFTYLAVDDRGAFSLATVTIAISPLVAPPVAGDDLW